MSLEERIDVAINAITESVLSNFEDHIHKIVRIVVDNERVVYVSDREEQFWLPLEETGESRETASKAVVTKGLVDFVNGGEPVMKAIIADKGRITNIANITVDVLPRRGNEIYLILRTDGSGWAVPGGFIDAGETAALAAQREFEEETQPASYAEGRLTFATGTPYQIEAMRGDPIRSNDRREKYSWTIPFIAWCQPWCRLSYGSDAAQARWFPINHYPKQLAFSHHHDIIKRGLSH